MLSDSLPSSLRLDQYDTSSDFAFSDFDLPSLIATMKQSSSWSNGELYSKVLLKNSVEQVIFTAIHDGTEIESFQSNDSVTFRIIEGKLELHVLEDSISIKKDQFMTLKQHINYRLTSGEETIFLLTVSNGFNATVIN